MSLLNQVLQDLDERMPSDDRQPIRLSVAQPVKHPADAVGGDSGSERVRLLLGLLVIAAFVAAVWVFYPADERPGSHRVVDLPLPAPSVAASATLARETPAVPVAPNDSADGHTQHEPGAPSSVPVSAMEKPSPEAAASAQELSVSQPAGPAPAPVPDEKAYAEAGAAFGHADEPQPARSPQKSQVDYLPLRNTQLPTFETSAPKPDAKRSTTDARVKTAKSPAPQSLEEIRREIELGELSFAEYLLQQRLRGAPADREARELLIGLMLRGERYDAAMQQLEKGLDHDPGNIKLSLIKARILAQSGQDEAAIRILESSPPSRTGRVERLQMLGALYQKQSRYEQARDNYRALLNLQPSAGPAWVGLALSLDGLGDPAAHEAYARALRLGGLPAAAEAYARQRIVQTGSKVD
jgi:MSHA biogenesis protein MshN